MSRRRRQSLSPSLFPFLAVLVCTLGTLILLLALVAQNTTDAAQQIAENPPDDRRDDPGVLTVRDVQELVEEEEFRLEELVSFREAQTGDLEERRTKLAHVEDHMRRIRERLQQISTAMEQAKSDDPLPAATAEEVRSMKQQLATEQLVVKKLREEIKTEKPRFVIVPHQGPNGTSRRPIYLECTSDGVVIWPEGVAITMWQMEHSTTDANPLDEALRAARYHAMQNYGDKTPPYPMLLVRPDGVESYYAARAAMQDWDDQFGYEMVPADIQLAYPQPDPGMRQRLEYAVKTAGQRVSQQSIARSFGGRGGRYSGGAGNAGRRIASTPADQNQSYRNQSPANHQTEAGQPGRYPTRGTGVANAGQGNDGRTAQGRTPYRAKKVQRLSVSQMDRQGRDSGFRDHRMLPTRTYGASGSYGNGETITSEAAKRRLERQMEDSVSSMSGGDSAQSLNQSASTALDEIGGNPSTASRAGANSAELKTAGQETGGSNSELLMPAADASAGDGSPTIQPGHADDVVRERPGQPPNQLTQDQPGAFGSGVRSMTSMSQEIQRQASQQQASRRQASQQTQAGDQKNSANSSASQRANQQPSANASPMVQRGGVDWALPSSVSLGRGNEIVRSVRLRVYPDRLVLLPRLNAGVEQSFPILQDGLDPAALQMATAVRDRIERWGATAPGARWSPRLKVDVMAGAEQRFYELERMLTGSGLKIERSSYSQADSNQRGSNR